MPYYGGGRTTPTHLQLDHIVPWSAGGSDRSSNLRTLCNVCNEQRSNHQADMDLVTVLPVANWCLPCTPSFYGGPIVDDGTIPDDAIPVFCGWSNHTGWTTDPSVVL